MACVSLIALDAPAAGGLKSLGRRAVGLDLGHELLLAWGGALVARLGRNKNMHEPALHAGIAVRLAHIGQVFHHPAQQGSAKVGIGYLPSPELQPLS